MDSTFSLPFTGTIQFTRHQPSMKIATLVNGTSRLPMFVSGQRAVDVLSGGAVPAWGVEPVNAAKRSEQDINMQVEMHP